MFQAERQTIGSNFKLTYSLREGCSVTNPSVATKQVDFPLKTPATEFYTLGNQQYEGLGEFNAKSELVLMTEEATNVVTYAFYRKKINVQSGIRIRFDFLARGARNASGFAMILSNRKGGFKNLNGGTGKAKEEGRRRVYSREQHAQNRTQPWIEKFQPIHRVGVFLRFEFELSVYWEES